MCFIILSKVFPKKIGTTCNIVFYYGYDSLNQAGQYDAMAVKDANSAAVESTMESVLSLDDGRWPRLAEDTCPTLINEAREDPFQFVGIRQPSPPPVLAKVQQESTPIPSSKVADPRPGPAKPSDDGLPSSNSYQHLHVVGVQIFLMFENSYLGEFHYLLFFFKKKLSWSFNLSL